jgi:ribosome-binding protein aMBF1 (putative translation factor)
MASQTPSFSDQIRRAVDDSGISRYRICKVIKLDKSVMSRFMAGKSGLSVPVLDRLAGLLKLRVVRSASNACRSTRKGR